LSGSKPSKDEKPTSTVDVDAESGHTNSVIGLDSDDDSGVSSPNLDDEENQSKASIVMKSNGKRESAVYDKSKSKGNKTMSGVLDLGFLGELYGKEKKGKSFANEQFHEALSIVSAGSVKSRAFMGRMFPCLDEQAKREEEFVNEVCGFDSFFCYALLG
jgi:hypothetical protein